MKSTSLRTVEDETAAAKKITGAVFPNRPDDLRAQRARDAEGHRQRQHLLRDRVRAIESFAREAKESMIEGCDEVQEGLSYLAAFDVIELLAVATAKDSQKE